MTNPVPSAQQCAFAGPRPAVTRTRYLVVVFAVILAIIQYIDRVAISQAAPLISRDLSLDKEQMALVFSAFTLAYALFEIPTGYMGDRLGARRVLIRVVLWWSFFTAATGWAWNLASLVAIRFLFGAGEAGCFPNIARAFNRWLPIDERVRAQGILWMFARWGGAVAPLLLVIVLQYVNWRRAFELFAVLGIVWCVFWFRWFRDHPADHPSVNAAELALMPTVEGKSDHPQDALGGDVLVAVAVAAVAAVLHAKLRLVFLRHVVPDLSARGAQVQPQGAGRHPRRAAALLRRLRLAVRRLRHAGDHRG